MSRKMNCPQCGKAIEYSPKNSHRPFCSERCRLIDLGEWASESYTIEAKPELDAADEYNDFSTAMTPQEQQNNLH